MIDAIEPATAAHVSGWVNEVAALADGERGVLQHFELTDSGPQLCRSENFVPIHAGFRALLCTGVLVELAGVAARRTGDPLQREGELQTSRRRRVLAASGRAGVPDDRRARLGDGGRRRRRRVQRRARGRVGLLRPRPPPRRAGMHRCHGRRAARLAAGAAASRPDPVVPQPHTPPQRAEPFRSAPPGALPHLQRGRARATSGPRTTRPSAPPSRPHPPATAHGSRSSATSKDVRYEGGVHRVGRAPGSPLRSRAHAGAPRPRPIRWRRRRTALAR